MIERIKGALVFLLNYFFVFQNLINLNFNAKNVHKNVKCKGHKETSACMFLIWGGMCHFQVLWVSPMRFWGKSGVTPILLWVYRPTPILLVFSVKMWHFWKMLIKIVIWGRTEPRSPKSYSKRIKLFQFDKLWKNKNKILKM